MNTQVNDFFREKFIFVCSFLCITYSSNLWAHMRPGMTPFSTPMTTTISASVTTPQVAGIRYSIDETGEYLDAKPVSSCGTQYQNHHRLAMEMVIIIWKPKSNILGARILRSIIGGSKLDIC